VIEPKTCYLCGPRGSTESFVRQITGYGPVREVRPFVCERCKAEHLDPTP